MVCSSRLPPFVCASATAAMIMPGVQKPHCRPWCWRNASCMGCSAPSLASPSMVVTLEPSQDAASTVHDFTARPSRCTTQAPHWLVSQPTCVPVSRRFSRTNCTSRVLGSISAVAALPFTVMDTFVIPLSGDLGAAARAACDGAGAAGVEPCPLRNRENMGRLLTVAAMEPGRDRLFVWSNSRLRHSRGVCAIARCHPGAAGTHRNALHTRSSKCRGFPPARK